MDTWNRGILAPMNLCILDVRGQNLRERVLYLVTIFFIRYSRIMAVKGHYFSNSPTTEARTILGKAPMKYMA